jgi:diguanylate cyclase (GGDEF)-like protein/PAS domain S-box-containing protein
MTGSVDSHIISRYWRQLVWPGVGAACLLFLFIKAQPVDQDLHNSLVGDLRELQMRDIELGEVVLQHHYKLLHNYDGVVAIMNRMTKLSAALAQHHQRGSLPDTPGIRLELSAVRQQLELKADALEEFKSHNALIKNSLIYLPRTVNDVLVELPYTDQYGHEQFELLLRYALLMVINQDDRTRDILKEAIGLIERVIPGLSDRARAPALLSLKHTNVIVENEEGMSSLLERFGSHAASHIGSGLEQLYQDHYNERQISATRYRGLLFLAAILMLGYAIHAYYRMREEEQQLRIAATAFETQEGILITGLDHRIIRVNSAFTRLTGYSAEEAVGRTPDLLKSGLHDDEFYPSMWDDIARDKFWQGEIRSRRKNGDIYLAWLTTTAVVADDDNHVTHYVSVFSDITLRKQAEEQIHQLAFYDPLTKLPNRRLLVDRLRHAMTAGTRKLDHGAILFIDLDNFKILNDTKGHAVGDMLLVETARRLQDCVRGGDSVARLGGDEFIVMLEGLGVETEQAAAQARAVAEKIRNSLGQSYRLGEIVHHSSCSIGISLFRDHEITVDDLLKRSDTAMYEAKASGRNALRFFDPSMQAALEDRSSLEVDLRYALSQQQFALFYQIQVNSDNQPIGAEVLLRWIHPLRGVVAPGEFISLAEDTGLILPIGLWVLEMACAQLKIWEANPLVCELQLSINVSARQFHQPDFVAQVREVLVKTGAAPNRLKIELTESVVLDNINETIAKMHDLKQLGVRFSMDDFGTGYSSLSYLTQLPLDQLKIDRSFVRNIGTKSTDAVIVQTIIGMGNSLEMEVIAEGVETEAQLAFLIDAGCVAYQGYLFSKPVALEEFENVVLTGGFARDRVGA